MCRRAALLLPLLAAVCSLLAADAPPAAYQADIKPASPEAAERMRKFRVPAGMKAELWAAEPLVANIVAFAFDERGRCYVVETFRLHDGVPDIRGHMDWLDEDLAARTVEDRFAMLRKHLGERFPTYSVHHDRVRLVEDTDGDGKADKATVFAEGFNTPVTGLAAGVLARKGRVYFTCIPDLWLLQDTDGDGRADVRNALSTGYGVHNGFIGHDLHGLRVGPDGKLYFSIGDRGLNVRTIDGRHILNPDSGAVLRCNLDGTGLEIVATGLRNPQELAFDEFGNLFTGDNNSDSGDRARWVHVVEGGDSGWRIGYQFMAGDYSRGPFNAERLWHPAPANTAAYVVPPLFNIADGPSGLCYDPGTGLPEQYRGRFFLADFRGGNSGASGIRAIKLKPKGASFELAEQTQFFWSVLPTDVDFGPDGAMYVGDWHEGWNKPGKGRLYRLVNPEFQGSALQKEVQRLLAEDLTKRPVAELMDLLAHADQRVRQEAQFALAARGESAVDPLNQVAKRNQNRLARLHAIWGLGQVGRDARDAVKAALEPLVKDADAEVRAQAAKVLGDVAPPGAAELLVPLLRDTESRVRFFAAQSLGKVDAPRAAAAVLEMLRDNADRDAYLRHAGVMALTGIKDMDALVAAADDRTPAVRTGAVLALRRLHSPQIVRFLNDPDPAVVLETARAIYDVPIPEAVPALAALITRQDLPDALGRRVLAANLRLGAPANAAAVAKFAARSDVGTTLRVEALRLLGQWAHPSGRDPILGLWRPFAPRPESVAADAVKPVLAELFNGPDAVRQQVAEVAGQLGVTDAAPQLKALLGDTKRSARARVEALKALAKLQAAGWAEAVQQAVTDPAESVRTAAYSLVAQLEPPVAMKLLEWALERGSVRERQAALATLGGMRSRDATTVLGRLLDRLSAGQVPPALQLDVIEAAEKRGGSALRPKLEHYQAGLPKNDPLATYRVALEGGHAENGRKIFYENQEVACLRCHKVGGDGGDVGPDLTHISKEKTREYILESIVEPNKQIAKGFETVILNLTSGRQLAGVVKAEDAKALTIMTPEAETITVPKADIETRDTGPSSMPSDTVQHLTKSELRDLIEFLAQQK